MDVLRRIWAAAGLHSAVMSESPDTVDAVEAPVRIRRTRTGPAWPDEDVLAKAFEGSNQVRASYRDNKGHLLRWPSPQLVGVASMKALSMNVDVLQVALQVWGEVTPVPKSMSIDFLKREATCLHRRLGNLIPKPYRYPLIYYIYIYIYIYLQNPKPEIIVSIYAHIQQKL